MQLSTSSKLQDSRDVLMQIDDDSLSIWKMNLLLSVWGSRETGSDWTQHQTFYNVFHKPGSAPRDG